MKEMIASRTFHSHFANAPHLHEAHSLLTWIVTSHRGSLKHIPLAEQTDFEKRVAPGALCLFKIVNAPEKEASFLAAKKQFATEHLYHGSRAYCWHSIVRNNLKNLSGTPQQVHGAGQGHGIYLGSDAQLANGHMQHAQGYWKNAALGK